MVRGIDDRRYCEVNFTVTRMGNLVSDQADDRAEVSAQELVTHAHVGPTERLRLGIQARTIAHALQGVFTGDVGPQNSNPLDLDRMFSGLFEHPSVRARDERCAIGRVYECMGEPTPEKLRCVVEASQAPDFEFLRKAVYRVLESGSLTQKKMAARALQGVDPHIASVARGLEQLRDKPQEEVQKPSSGGVPHKVIICPNIGGDPHRSGCCS